MNITDVLRRNAYAFPERIALLCDGRTINYGTLARTIGLVASRLAAAEISRGQCVAISLRNPIGYLIVALAVARIGAIATPLHRNRPIPVKEELLGRHTAHALVHDADDPWRSTQHPQLHYLAVTDLFVPPPPEGLKQAPPANDVDDTPWMIALSSGTTGTPKSIPQQHQRAALMFNLLNSVSGSESLAPRVLPFISITTCVAMNNVMLQLYAGRTAVLTESMSAENFFQVLRRDRPDHVLMATGVARTLTDYAETAHPGPAGSGAALRSVTLAGAVASPALRARVARYIAPAILLDYGATEIGSVAFRTPDDEHRPDEFVGRLHPWVQAQVVDEEDQPLGRGQRGVLRFKTPTMTDAYLKDEAATARAFRDGWFYPGDIGSLDGAGFLTLAGRIDHLINVGGDKIDPYEIEAVLNSHPAIAESAVVAVPGDSGIVVPIAALVTSGPYDPEDLKQLCRERLGQRCVPKHFVSLPSLPKNTGGKIMRSELTTMIEQSPDGGTPGKSASNKPPTRTPRARKSN